MASDSTKRVFQLKLPDQSTIPCAYTDAQEEDVLTARKEYLSMELVLLGVGVYDRNERLVRVQSILELAAMRSLRTFDERVQKLQALPLGWYDGAGQTVSERALAAIGVLRGLLDQTDLPLPYLYPTPNGGAQAEWTRDSLEVQVTFDPAGSVLACWDDGATDGDVDISADEATLAAHICRGPSQPSLRNGHVSSNRTESHWCGDGRAARRGHGACFRRFISLFGGFYKSPRPVGYANRGPTPKNLKLRAGP